MIKNANTIKNNHKKYFKSLLKLQKIIIKEIFPKFENWAGQSLSIIYYFPVRGWFFFSLVLAKFTVTVQSQ